VEKKWGLAVGVFGVMTALFCFQRMKGVSLTRPGSRGAVLLRSGDERRCALFAASARNETPPSGRAATGLAAPSLGEWAADVRLEPSSGSPSRDDRFVFDEPFEPLWGT